MADEFLYLSGKKSKLAEPEESEYLKLVGPKPAQFQNPLPSDNTIGRHLVEALPMAGAIAGDVLGPLGGMAGTGLGTMVKQALQKARPDLLGEAPSGGMDIAADTGKEILLNNILPKGLGKLGGLLTQIGMVGPKAAAAINLGMLPAVREGVSQRMADSIGEQFGQSYKRLGDFQPLKFAEETVPYQPISISPETAISQNIRFNQNAAEFQPIKITLGEEFQPFTKTKAFNKGSQPTVTSTGGTEKAEIPGSFQTQGGAFKENTIPGQYRAVRSGPEKQVPSGVVGRTLGAFKPGEDKLTPLITAPHVDAEKTLAEFTGENASRYADAMPPETYSAVKDLLTEMKGMQKKKAIDSIISYQKGRLLWSGGMGALGMLGHPGAAAIGESPVVLNYMMDRIMANKETAKLVTAALRTPAKAPQADLINKALTVALPRLFLEGTGVDTTSGK